MSGACLLWHHDVSVLCDGNHGSHRAKLTSTRVVSILSINTAMAHTHARREHRMTSAGPRPYLVLLQIISIHTAWLSVCLRGNIAGSGLSLAPTMAEVEAQLLACL